MNILYYLPIFLLLACGVTAFIFDRIVILHNLDKDRGDYWVFVTTYIGWLLPFILVSSWMQTIYPIWWLEGYHLHFDILNNAFNLTVDTRYYLALAIPILLWLFLLIIGILKLNLDQNKSRWLAGAIGFSNSRFWILSYAALLLSLPLISWTDLGGGEGSYSAVTWGTLAVFSISLIGIAFSQGKLNYAVSTEINIETKIKETILTPWPEAVKAQGIELTEDIEIWDQDISTRPVQGTVAENLVKRLELMGAEELPPELVEALANLLNPQKKQDIHSLVIAPDDCGQTEIVALAAKILEQRYHTITLIITINKAEQLAKQLRHWVAGAGKVSCNETPRDAMIWVVDAEVLSDNILPTMQNPDKVKRIGFVVWWHLEKYTGVLSANLWAISRRLDRFIKFQGRQEVRTLALVRTSLDDSSQINAFLNQLLPSHHTNIEVRIPVQFPKKIRLHVLESHQEFFQKNRNINIRYPLLTTSKVSVEANWNTYIEIPDYITTSDVQAFLQLPINNSTLKSELYQQTETAEIRLIYLEPADVLGIIEMLSQTGRAAKTNNECHIGIVLPDNPYIDYLISTLAERQENHTKLGFGISKRLVGAKSQKSVISRHLKFALYELEETRSGLLKNFNWEEKLITKTLDDIYKEGELIETKVRYLNERNHLVIEPKYKSRQLPPESERGQPLNTVSFADKLIFVRDPTQGLKIQMRVDPERLTIQAYPYCIFYHAGRRYKIEEWNWETLKHTGYITCQEENLQSNSWRIRTMEVYDIKALLGENAIDISQTGIAFKKQKVSLHYEELISGTFIQTMDSTTCKPQAEIKHRLNESISKNFATQALILGFTNPEDLIALNSLCQALRQVLPIHLGIEANALEIVPVNYEGIFGIAIVDLYPQGIGLVDAFYNDARFILSLLKWTKEWLENCSCDKDVGCEKCLNTLSARAAVGDAREQYPTPAGALRILTKVV
jgi:hypothetical protein